MFFLGYYTMILTLLVVPVIYKLINSVDKFFRKFYEVGQVK